MAFVLSGTTSARASSPPLVWRSAKKKGAPRSYEIGLRRLGVAEQGPELIELSLNATGASARAAVIGKLTDAALRARLGDSSTHSSNEIAAIRHALAPDRRQRDPDRGMAGPPVLPPLLVGLPGASDPAGDLGVRALRPGGRREDRRQRRRDVSPVLRLRQVHPDHPSEDRRVPLVSVVGSSAVVRAGRAVVVAPVLRHEVASLMEKHLDGLRPVK